MKALCIIVAACFCFAALLFTAPTNAARVLALFAVVSMLAAIAFDTKK